MRQSILAKVKNSFDNSLEELIEEINEYTYEDMPSNEQRLHYLDNPRTVLTGVKDFNYRVLWKRYYDEKKTRAGLLQHSSEEDEVPE